MNEYKLLPNHTKDEKELFDFCMEQVEKFNITLPVLEPGKIKLLLKSEDTEPMHISVYLKRDIVDNTPYLFEWIEFKRADVNYPPRFLCSARFTMG